MRRVRLDSSTNAAILRNGFVHTTERPGGEVMLDFTDSCTVTYDGILDAAIPLKEIQIHLTNNHR